MKVKLLILFFICITFLFCTEKKRKSSDMTISADNNILDDTSTVRQFNKLIEDYESKDRDEWQHPGIILQALGDLKGKTIADIGAGTGYFSFKLARHADTVYAVDIEPRFLEYIEERKEDFQSRIGKNVITILTTPDNPGLVDKKVDAVLLVNTYSYINNRTDYFKTVRKVIKPQGKLCVVEFKKKDIPIGPPDSQKVSAEIAMEELKASGFTSFKVDSVSLPYQYILLAF